jgi:hypothetical protein
MWFHMADAASHKRSGVDQVDLLTNAKTLNVLKIHTEPAQRFVMDFCEYFLTVFLPDHSEVIAAFLGKASRIA